MDEKQFWELIERAWQAVGGYEKQRSKLAAGNLSYEKAEELVEELSEALDQVIPTIKAELEQLAAEKLLAFDRILERKLYDIDRAEIQEATDGSDDGFLYARGFIVAIGQAYYDAVNADPTKALLDIECEEMCYLSFHLYEKRYGAMPSSEISRESFSNQQGWED
jgi:hypothetical protein